MVVPVECLVKMRLRIDAETLAIGNRKVVAVLVHLVDPVAF